MYNFQIKTWNTTEETLEASFIMMNQAILMMPKAQMIDSRLQDQAPRI